MAPAATIALPSTSAEPLEGAMKGWSQAGKRGRASELALEGKLGTGRITSATHAPKTFILGGHILGATPFRERKTRDCQEQMGPPTARIDVSSRWEGGTW